MSWSQRRDDFDIADPFEPDNGLKGEASEGVDEPSSGHSEHEGPGMVPGVSDQAAGGDLDSDEGAGSDGPAAAEVLRTLEETAHFFEVSMPTLRSWLASGCPVRERGGPGKPYQLSLKEVAEWRKGLQDKAVEDKRLAMEEEAQLRMALVGDDMLPDPGGSQGSRALSPAQRKDALQAELQKVKLAKERRELVLASEVQVIWSRANAEVRERLRALPDQMGLRFGFTDDQADAMLEMVDDVLTDLSNSLSTMTEEAAAS